MFDVGIRTSRLVLILEEGKAGKIMAEQIFGFFLGRLRLTINHCAEKTSPLSHQKTNGVRLFKD